MDKENIEYKLIRELLASRLWRQAHADVVTLPWRHDTHADARDDFRNQADKLLEELEEQGIKVDVSKKSKAMAALKGLMVEPEHLAYTLPGFEF